MMARPLLDRRGSSGDRRALVTLLTLLCIPLLFLLLCVVAEVNHLWQARIQLENALEAAALASIKEWGDQGGSAKHIAVARSIGREYGRANYVQGVALDLEDRVLAPSVCWTFGTAQARGTEFDFTPCPDAEQKLAVVLTATVRVAPLWSWGPGRWIGVSTLNADVAAYYETSSKPPRPRLIRARLVSADGDHQS